MEPPHQPKRDPCHGCGKVDFDLVWSNPSRQALYHRVSPDYFYRVRHYADVSEAGSRSYLRRRHARDRGRHCPRTTDTGALVWCVAARRRELHGGRINARVRCAGGELSAGSTCPARRARASPARLSANMGSTTLQTGWCPGRSRAIAPAPKQLSTCRARRRSAAPRSR
jgi:hypothetical protein